MTREVRERTREQSTYVASGAESGGVLVVSGERVVRIGEEHFDSRADHRGVIVLASHHRGDR
jgi:hypothetical protein